MNKYQLLTSMTPFRAFVAGDNLPTQPFPRILGEDRLPIRRGTMFQLSSTPRSRRWRRGRVALLSLKSLIFGLIGGTVRTVVLGSFFCRRYFTTPQLFIAAISDKVAN
jgi:hypothetical protein